MPCPAKRASHVRTIQVFPQVHQRQKSAQDSCLQVIGQMQAAGCHPGQPLSILCDEAHDFSLPLVGSIAERSLTAHLRATALNRKREVKNANLLLFRQGWRRVVLASRNFARCGHMAQTMAVTIGNHSWERKASLVPRNVAYLARRVSISALPRQSVPT